MKTKVLLTRAHLVDLKRQERQKTTVFLYLPESTSKGFTISVDSFLLLPCRTSSYRSFLLVLSLRTPIRMEVPSFLLLNRNTLEIAAHRVFNNRLKSPPPLDQGQTRLQANLICAIFRPRELPPAAKSRRVLISRLLSFFFCRFPEPREWTLLKDKSDMEKSFPPLHTVVFWIHVGEPC